MAGAGALGEVAAAFAAAGAGAGGARAGCPPDAGWGVPERFAAALGDPAQRAAVPGLRAALAEGPPAAGAPRLVRFRGLVRDILDPEYYVGAAWDPAAGCWRTAKFTDGSPLPGGAEPAAPGSPEAPLWERRRVFCTALPAQSPWARAMDEADGAAAAGGAALAAAAPGGGTPASKRGREEAAGMEVEGGEEGVARPGQRRAAPGAGAGAAAAEAAGADAQGALARVNGGDLPCILKLYEGCGLQGLRLNAVVEVVGLLFFNPVLVRPQDAAEGFEAEALAVNPPESLVPRIHVLAGGTVSPWDALLRSPACPTAEALGRGAADVRARALGWLAEAAGGDALAAEYLLMELLSRVYARPDPVVLGRHSLNLSRAGPGLAASVGGALARLVPHCKLLELSLDVLNDGDLRPTKDYELNRLLPGELQLADGTVLVVDETALSAGKLEHQGVQNLGALKAALSEQRYEIDFKYYQLPVECDLPSVVVSQGKSLLGCDTVLPLAPGGAPPATTAITAAGEGELNLVRAFLGTARAVEHKIGEEVSARVQEDLVRRRQGNPQLGDADFSRWLTLARLFSLSRGEAELSWASWEGLQALETARLQRLQPPRAA